MNAHQTRCPKCKSQRISRIFTRWTFQTMRCRGCKHEFDQQIPTLRTKAKP